MKNDRAFRGCNRCGAEFCHVADATRPAGDAFAYKLLLRNRPATHGQRRHPGRKHCPRTPEPVPTDRNPCWRFGGNDPAPGTKPMALSSKGLARRSAKARATTSGRGCNLNGPKAPKVGPHHTLPRKNVFFAKNGIAGALAARFLGFATRGSPLACLTRSKATGIPTGGTRRPPARRRHGGKRPGVSRLQQPLRRSFAP